MAKGASPKLRWVLRETLQANNLTRYAVRKASGVAMNTIRTIYDGTPRRADFAVLEAIVGGLTTLTGKPMSLEDVLVWDGQVRQVADSKKAED